MKKLTFIAAVFALTSSIAFAHSELKMSMPSDKAVLDSAPKEIMLHFSEPVRLTELKIEKQGSKEQNLNVPKDASAAFSVPAPTLEAGDYVVNWRALSDDGHVMKGQFAFGVQAAHAAHSQRSRTH